MRLREGVLEVPSRRPWSAQSPLPRAVPPGRGFRGLLSASWMGILEGVTLAVS